MAKSLDYPETEQTRASLSETCGQVRTWAADHGRDGELVTKICDTALDAHDWAGARKMMLNDFPHAERQPHLRIIATQNAG